MNNQTVYWLWIQQVIGYASNKITYILDNFTFAEDFYRASLEEKLSCGCFTRNDTEKLKDTSLDNARQIMKRCRECGIDIINIGDVAYPERLMHIQAQPAVIFIKGNKEVLSEDFMIAMIGTRNATPYGKRNAFKLAHDLAMSGAVIVSGGALGIDTYSHRGALNADGKTVCVLGCGMEYKYLTQNDEMKRNIIKRGAVISEYPPDMRASRVTFPQRNRIISGLSRGVVVVEAGQKSGSLITVNRALDQGRDVFSVPGDVASAVSFGTNELIKEGAFAVTEAEDVITFYSFKGIRRGGQKAKASDSSAFEQLELSFDNVKPRAKKNPKANRSAKISHEEAYFEQDSDYVNTNTLPKIAEEDFEELSDNAKRILAAFDKDKLHVDRLVEKTGLSISCVNSALTELEMLSCIEPLEGRNYKILVSIW